MVCSAGLVNGVSQCCNVLRQPARPKIRCNLQQATLVHTASRKLHHRQHLPAATGTQVSEQELASAGNQAKALELQVEDDIEKQEVEEVYEEQMEEAEANDDGKEAAIAALQTPVETPAPQNFALNFLWLEKNVAVSVDQLYDQGQSDRRKRSPVTEYFFWPRVDAWEELKDALEAKPWVQERDKIILLNQATEIINFWQDNEPKKTVEEARAAFPDCTFQGAT